MQWSREMYLVGKKDAVLQYAEPALGIELYFFTASNGKPGAVAFRGKAMKPSVQYYYSTEESRAKCTSEWIKAVAEDLERKKAKAAERVAFQHTLEVGAILVSSWGWEQTNIDFYEVVAVKGKSVVIREIAQEKTQTQWLAGECSPRPAQYISEPMTKRVGMGNRIAISKFQNAGPIDAGRKSYYYSQYA